jgi:hypothetical protein
LEVVVAVTLETAANILVQLAAALPTLKLQAACCSKMLVPINPLHSHIPPQSTSQIHESPIALALNAIQSSTVAAVPYDIAITNMTYLLGNEGIHLVNKRLVFRNAGQGTRLDAVLNVKVFDEVTCTFLHHTIHLQVACCQINGLHL